MRYLFKAIKYVALTLATFIGAFVAGYMTRMLLPI